MGIEVQVETESGEVKERLTGHNHLVGFMCAYAVGMGTFRVMRYINEYGVTLFNALQLSDFMTDWDEVAEHYTNPEFAETIVEVWRLAERCLQTGLYLRFTGDD